MTTPKSNENLRPVALVLEIIDPNLAIPGKEFNLWLKDGKDDYEVIAFAKGSVGGQGKIAWDIATNDLANYMKKGNKVRGKIIELDGGNIITEIYVNKDYHKGVGCVGILIPLIVTLSLLVS